MGEDDEVERYRSLSREYLQAAKQNDAAGAVAPARYNAIHALELGVKAALLQATGEVPKTHNVGGAFGLAFRGRVAQATGRRVTRLLREYGAARYPGWEVPSSKDLRDDLGFVERFLTIDLPRLLKEGRA